MVMLCTYSKDSLFTSQWGPSPGPEKDVGLSTGDDGVWISGMELHSQDHFVSGLQEFHSVRSESEQVKTS